MADQAAPRFGGAIPGSGDDAGVGHEQDDEILRYEVLSQVAGGLVPVDEAEQPVVRLGTPGLDRQLRRDAGVTHADYSLLARLSAAPGRTLAMSSLAEQLKFTCSRLTRAVIRLEKSGYVRRRDNPADRRGHLVELTDNGMELLTEAAPGHVAAVRSAVFDALSSEQAEQLATISAAITAALEQADEKNTYPSAPPWHRR
ncbi:MarR family winged helix-turn-helix transcriptional regulator [Streptomyces lydicus]|uniref:MarR family winged helix-turn-helix transcriptional regulator n=1 Tax=Streptomyces lydicus TaxID=47763 RepID=UPI0036E0235C